MNGLRLENKKEGFFFNWTVKRTPPPPRVLLPLQLGGAVLLPVVKLGQKVRAGEKIAIPADGRGTALHASLSGEVTSLGVFPHPVLGEANAIEITSDKQDSKIETVGCERSGWENFSPEQLQEIFLEAGLVTGLDRPSALHYKTSLAQGSKKTLVINACESEPYIAAAHCLLMSHPLEILKGSEMIMKALGAERIVIAVENHTQEAAELLKSKIFFMKWKHCEVRLFPVLYPQEMEPLIASQLARIEKTGDSSDYFVVDASTAFAAYEAVVFQKPFYERVVTVAGECLVEPKHLWVRVGTEFEELIKQAKGLLREPGKVVMNGPMRGYAQDNLAVPVLKETRAILALPPEILKSGETESCIRSGRCIESCPVDISPILISGAIEKGEYELAERYGLKSCIYCHVCNYVCPSKRPMADLIRQASFKPLSLFGSKPW